jgi:hypothetical protein
VNDFERGVQYFHDPKKRFEHCKTAKMINGWNNEERITKNGYVFQNWYQSRNSCSL